MKKVFTLLVLLTGFSFANAQAPDWLWAQGTGLSGFQNGCRMFVNKDGDIYTSGRLGQGTSVLGGVTLNTNGVYAFNGKFHPDGTFDWVNVYPYGTFDYLFAYYVDSAENGYSTGCVNSSSLWAQRVNKLGVKTWSITVPVGNTQGTAIVADRKGNMYLGGGFSSPSTFGGLTVNPNGSGNCFLVKYNSAGVAQWAENIGGAGMILIKAMEVDKQGYLYFTGAYTGATTLGSLPLSAYDGNENLFIAKYDSNGTALSVVTVGNAGPVTNLDEGSDLKLDSLGNMYVAGTFQLTTHFGSFTKTSAGGYDAFVGKLDKNGNWLWVNTGGGPSYREEGTGIALDKDLDVYVTGIFQNTMTFGCSSITNPSPDKDGMFVAKYGGKLGELQWLQRSYATDGDENSGGITVDQHKFVYLTNDFVGVAVFGPYSVTAPPDWPNNDMFIARLDSVPNQHISILPDSSYCQGSAQALPFAATGSYNSGNSFTFQLSDSSGSFNAPVNIGSVNGSAGGNANITIPSNTLTGNNYLIRVTSSNPAVTSSDYCYKIKILSATALLATGDTSVCQGSQVQLNVSGGSGYMWSSVNQLSCTGCSNPIVTVSKSDTIKITGVSTGSCPSVGQVIVQLGGNTHAGIVTAIRDTVCQGTPAQLTLNGNTSDSIEWQSSPTNSAFIPVGINDTIHYTTNPLLQSTWYRAKVGAGGCVDTSAALQIIVPPPLTASYLADVSGKKAVFNSSGSIGNISNYYWDFGDGQTSTDSSPAHTYARDSTYSVCLTIYDGSNCSYTYCRDVNINTTGAATVNGVGILIIYPNPFNHQISINGTKLGSPVKNIDLYDVLGRVITTPLTNNDNSRISLNVSALTNGMYYVVVKTENGVYIQKVIKQ